MAGPGQRAEMLLALLHPGPGHGPAALKAEAHIGGERQPDPDLRVGRTANGLRVGPVGVRPDTGLPPVVEYRLAVEGHLHLAGHAPDGAQQHIVGVVVGGRAAVCVRQFALVLPRAHEQRAAFPLGATRAVASQSDRNPYSPIGGNSDSSGTMGPWPGVTMSSPSQFCSMVRLFRCSAVGLIQSVYPLSDREGSVYLRCAC